MMRFFRKNRGSISIFLCLIMLPMVTYSSMIIDVSRLQSSRTAISSAGDLTMNAALSEYEQVLQDMYGLFATVQSGEDLEPALKQYFKQTIESSLNANATTDQYIETLANQLTGKVLGAGSGQPVEFDNLIEMQLDDFNYEPVNGSALANPAVMKRQIIDYMKYKGPVSLVTTLLPKLNFLKESGKQTEVVEKKITYTQKLNSIQEACEAMYYAIVGKDEAKGFNQIAESFNTSDSLKDVRDYIRLGLANMSLLLLWYRHTPFEEYQITWESLDTTPYSQSVGSHSWSTDFNAGNATDIAKSRELLNNIYSNACSIINTTNQGADCLFWDFSNIQVRSKDDVEILNVPGFKFHPVPGNLAAWKNEFNQYKTDVSNADVGVSSLRTRYERQGEFYSNKETYTKYKFYYEQYKDLRDKYAAVLSKYDDQYSNEVREFNAAVEAYSGYLRTVAAENLAIAERNLGKPPAQQEEPITPMSEDDYFKSEGYSFDREEIEALEDEYDVYHDKDSSLNSGYNAMHGDNLPGEFNEVMGLIQDMEIYSVLAEKNHESVYQRLNRFIESVDTLLKQIDVVVKQTDEVLVKIAEAKAAKEEWQGRIETLEDGPTKTGMMNDMQTLTEGLDEENIKTFRAYAAGYQTLFQNLFDALNGITFYSNTLCQSSYGVYRSLDTYYHDHKGGTGDFDPWGMVSEGGGLRLTDVDALHFTYSGLLDGYVDFSTADPRPVEEKENFFFVLKSICEPVGQQTLDPETTTQIDAINDSGVGADGSTPSVAPAPAEPTEPEEPAEPKASENFDGILQAIKDYGTQNLNDNSAPQEFKVKKTSAPKDDSSDHEQEGDKAKESLGEAKGFFDKLLKTIGDFAKTVGEYAYMEEYFTEMFTCQTDALPDADFVLLSGLGKNELNTETEWFGKEIEYIIWGGGDLDANLTKNEALIYTIRFALNAVYAFTAADIQAFALEVATAIAGWTVVGVPIVQACITVAIALAESAYDLWLLKDGEDVPIYKNSMNFVCSPTGLLKEVASKAVEKVVEYAANALEEKLNETIDAVSEAGYETIGEAEAEVEAYVSKFMEEQKRSLISTIENQFVNPILNSLTPVLNQIDATTDSVGTLVVNAVDKAYGIILANIQALEDGTVKTLCLTFYEEAAEAKKGDLTARLTTYVEAVHANTDPGNLRDMLTGTDGIITNWMNSIDQQINEKVSEMGNNMMGKIHEVGDKAIGDLKSVLHDEMNKVATQVTTSVQQGIEGAVEQYADDALKKVDSASKTGGFSLNYKEYCKLFVFVNIAVDETKMLQRAGALIQANVRNAKAEANPSFELTKANTLVYVDAKVRMGTLFPWFVSANENQAAGESNIAVDLSHLGSNFVTINYSGINGY